jgi:hypothetical protein
MKIQLATYPINGVRGQLAGFSNDSQIYERWVITVLFQAHKRLHMLRKFKKSRFNDHPLVLVLHGEAASDIIQDKYNNFAFIIPQEGGENVATKNRSCLDRHSSSKRYVSHGTGYMGT